MKKIFFSGLLGVGMSVASGVLALDFTDQGDYMGSSDCRSCHERFYELWSTSHHGLAMQAFSADFAKTLKPMKEEVVSGDSRFLVELGKTGGFLRETKPDGTIKRYPIRHALGGRNVYFFLVPMQGGRLQVAPVAYYVHTGKWYSSTASMVRHFQSGPADSALDWTDRQLTFNTACHDCHVSQLQKNYDPATDSYHTTWKEAGINCETCHGPAETHIRVAEEAEKAGVELKELKLLRFHEDLNMEQRDATCSPCHAKMVPLTDAFTPGELFFNHYDLTSYEDRDFYVDGRDHGENYTMTGWMANPCANAGKLECIKCHTSSGRFRFKENPNQACLPCHQKKVDEIVEHSHHPAKAGLSCIDCHMPKTAQAYMTRSDHSFRPPAPAASLEFGSPNACVICHFPDQDPMWANTVHTNRADLEWANKHFRKMFETDQQDKILRLGRVIQACRDGNWDQLPEILAYLDDPDCDPPSQVAILRLLVPCPYPAKWEPMLKKLGASHPWVRATAAASLQYDQTAPATKGLLKACSDPFRTVRIRAAGALLGRDLSSASKEERDAFEKAKAEYWNSLVIWPDRWSSHYNQGIYFDRLGEPQKALKAYEKSMELREDALQPKLNASMDYARLGQPTNAYTVLKEALAVAPNNPMVLFNLALMDAEFKNLDATEKHLRAAYKADSNMAQAAYNLGVLLCRKPDEEGFEWLKKATQTAPENWDYLSVRLFFLEQADRTAEMETALKEAIASEHAPPEAYFTLIGNYLKAGRKAEALQICKKAKLAPHLPADARRYAAQMEQEISAP